MMTVNSKKSSFIRWFNQLMAMTKKEFIILTRYRLNFFLSFLQVMFILFLFVMAAYVLSPKDATNFGVGVMFYSFILFMFLSTALWDIGNGIRQEQYQGTLESLFLTPISYFSALAAKILPNLIWTSLNVIFSFVFISLIFGEVPFENVGLGLIVLTFTLAICFGFSFAFAGLALKYKESMNILINFVQFFFIIVCGMFFPFSALPEFLQVVSRLIPLSYGVDLFRATLVGYQPELLPYELEFLIVIVSGIILPFIGLVIFQKTVSKAKREGNLAEY